MRIKDQLLTVAMAYCEAKSLSLSRVSTLTLNDGKRLDAIRGGGDLGTERFEHAMQWLSDNWPGKASWPKGIARPSPAPAKAVS